MLRRKDENGAEENGERDGQNTGDESSVGWRAAAERLRRAAENENENEDRERMCCGGKDEGIRKSASFWGRECDDDDLETNRTPRL